VEARKAADRSRGTTAPTPSPTAGVGEPGVSLTQRRLADPAAVIAGLPADHRPPPAVSAYNELLPRRRANSESAKVKQRKGTAS
jgi:hypothetical protein